MCIVAAVELLVSLAIVGGKGLLDYPRFAWQVNRLQAPGVIVPANMANLRGLFMGWKAMSTPTHWMEIALIVATLGLLIWASRQWNASDVGDTQRWDFGFSICLVASYLAGYHGYNQDMSFLLLPLLLALDRTLAQWDRASGGGKFLQGLLLFSPLYLVLTLQLSHQNLFAIVLLCFAGYLAASATTRPPALASRSTE
jgi:hypothetical protein